jgi:hypothetical protein
VASAAETLISGFGLDAPDAEPLAQFFAALLRQPESAKIAQADLDALKAAGLEPNADDREEYLAGAALGWFVGHIQQRPDDLSLFLDRGVRDAVARLLAHAKRTT